MTFLIGDSKAVEIKFNLTFTTSLPQFHFLYYKAKLSSNYTHLLSRPLTQKTWTRIKTEDNEFEFKLLPQMLQIDNHSYATYTCTSVQELILFFDHSANVVWPACQKALFSRLNSHVMYTCIWSRWFSQFVIFITFDCRLGMRSNSKNITSSRLGDARLNWISTSLKSSLRKVISTLVTFFSHASFINDAIILQRAIEPDFKFAPRCFNRLSIKPV